MISAQVSDRLSGFIGIGENGNILISRNLAEVDSCHSIFQAGPFLVDPGGQMGINTKQNRHFDRLVLVRLVDGQLILHFAEKIDLFDLAQQILVDYENVDLAINLDGGPSVCLVGKDVEVRPSKIGIYLISCQ